MSSSAPFHSMSSFADEDTCRICRSPATASEPLFFPCKCSGSIKHVHQECLMEWLTHSQKKYCELCKTPFRFTKLYRQDMPQTLPTAVFVKRALLHLLGWLWWWARGALVVLTWGVILPWSMRFAWRAVFFVSDGGFARDMAFEQMLRGADHSNRSIAIITEELSAVSQTQPGMVAADASHLTANLSAGQIMSAFVDGVSQTLKSGSANLSAFAVLKHLVKSPQAGQNDTLGALELSNVTQTNTTLSELVMLRRSSVLSEIRFLRTLSNHPRFNRFVMDVLEGQIITLLVVVAFILIFLIREWVVQQQPMINLQNFEAENEDVAPAPNNANAEQDAAQDPHEDDEDNEVLSEDTPESDVNDLPTARAQALHWIDSLSPELQEAMRQGRVRDVVTLVHEMPEEDIVRFKSKISEWHQDTSTQQEAPSESSSGSVRPGMPSRGRSFLAAEIRRSLEEGSNSDADTEHTSLESSDSSWQDVARTADEEGPRLQKKKGKTAMTYYNADLNYPSAPRFRLPQDETRSNTTDLSHSSIQAGSTDQYGLPGADEELRSSEVKTDSEEMSEAALQSDSDQTSLSELELSPQPDQTNTDLLPLEPTLGEPAANIFVRLCDWFWGDMGAPQENQDQPGNDEHVVGNLAEEAPFVPFANAQPAVAGHDNDAHQDPHPVAPGAQGGLEANDIDAAEDAEDLEGIMELIGMQGPLMGLFQNVMFCACLISLSICVGVWMPYYQGKIVFMVLGNPSSLIKWPVFVASHAGGVIVDVSILALGHLVHLVSGVVTLGLRVSSWIVPFTSQENPLNSLVIPANSIASAASKRLSATFDQLLRAGSIGAMLDFLNIYSHAQLKYFQQRFPESIALVGTHVLSVCRHASQASPTEILRVPLQICRQVFRFWLQTRGLLKPLIAGIKSIPLTLSFDHSSSTQLTSQSTPDFAYWSASDRAIAVFTGYLLVALLGALYLAYGGPFFQDPKLRRVEAMVADALEQAGGVLKVILIISIEMIIFPLYCGLLLDLALLPLNEHSTILSRIEFSVNKPWTSGFVHWFIGTCYMFHFALFVSMCRKIMRPGVLYFIRDPDDPTFHPVRDVLERSVTSQLRKIALSALVYGALVIFCLGSVVWTLDYLFASLLPIKWFTNDPTIEFPLDLLFYSFITPFVLQIAKPSEGLHNIYTWWFKRCARLLRLSDFLFAEPHPDEQGLLLESDMKDGKDDGVIATLAARDGRFVRAPNSDLVRVPKGTPAFVEVDQNNNRLDDKPEEEGIHAKSSEMTKMVYLPPYFRARVGLFMFTIWVFAALTGVGVTIIPLISGRGAIQFFFQPSQPVNDIYAFTLGLYVLGSAMLGASHYALVVSQFRHYWSNTAHLAAGLRSLGQYISRIFKIVYIYGMLAILGPLICAALWECYILIPLHSYTGAGQRHAISIIQDWTLGVLYGRIFLMSFALTGHDGDSRFSRAARAVFQNGYMDPDARIATRCFVLPAILFGLFSLGLPALIATSLNHIVFAARDLTFKTYVYRVAYPSLLALCLTLLLTRYLMKAARRWRGRIRDEVYLVGERLHNFGEKRLATHTSTLTSSSAIK